MFLYYIENSQHPLGQLTEQQEYFLVLYIQQKPRKVEANSFIQFFFFFFIFEHF